MLSNYLKLAIRILGRRKFFTFISLFCISFTLGILMVILSFLQSEIGSNPPLTQKDDFVYVPTLQMRKVHMDTIPTIDTLYKDGVAVYDTTFKYKRKGSSESNSSVNSNIIIKYLDNLPSAKYMTFFNDDVVSDLYVNGVKMSLNIMYTDENYWTVFDHKIIEGRSFDERDVASTAKVVVISDQTAKDYFGTDKNIVNREMLIEAKNYTVIGIYQHKGKLIDFVSPDGVIPYTNQDLSKQQDHYFGSFAIMFVKNENASIDKLKSEIADAGSLIPFDHPDNKYGYEEIEFIPKTFNEMYAQNIYWEEDPSKSYNIMKWFLICLLLFFILLPTLNLINLNVSRIMDRSAEIGVRKAFGANRQNVVMQFVIENIVQTLIGGVLGLGLALSIIYLLNNSGFLGKAELMLNPQFFLYSLIITFMFGVLSGLLPALKMSNLQIVNALGKAHK